VRIVPGLKDGASVAEALRLVAQHFRLSRIEEPEADARVLLGYALHLDRPRLVAQSERVLETREVNAISALVARRCRREPVARITGVKEFWSLALHVTPDVLVPRPETETLIEAALDVVVRGGLRLEMLRILDIGAGSGALLLALLTELPNATGIGTDISLAALAVARDNAARHGLAARASFVLCDGASAVRGPFDFIVSNPPYIASGEIATLAAEVRNYDPRIALDGGVDGLDRYRALAADARRNLAPGGRLIVELGARQERAVATIFTKARLKPGPARKDLAGIARALTADALP
jgi:release factor glutamine methyltransferase